MSVSTFSFLPFSDSMSNKCVRGVCEWVGLGCVFKTTTLIFLKQKSHELRRFIPNIYIIFAKQAACLYQHVVSFSDMT